MNKSSKLKTRKLVKTWLSVLFLTIAFWNNLFAADPPFLQYKQDPWVVNQLKSMSLEEKIAQLMMISVSPKQGKNSKQAYANLIKDYQPGGILVMQGTPHKTARWINDFQQLSKIPLLVATDGEWGVAMRTDSVMKFPYAQAVGAVQDSGIVYEMGRNMAKQLKILGINMNFAPVADINTNPANPVINFRSFGENKVNVAIKADLIAKGMQDEGVIAVAKHFPGHGDTSSDSHKSLPFLAHSKERMNLLETFPFRYLSNNGISGIMSAHLNVPALDPSGNPSSLSKKIITGYLKGEIGFKGFVVTDAMNMKGVKTPNGNAEVEALKAGNDLLEFVPNLSKAIQSVKNAVKKGEISKKEINEKCRTILALKRWAGLNNYQPTDLTDITKRLNNKEFEVVNRKVIKNTLTVLKNINILPVEHLDTLKIASVMIGALKISPFQKMLDNYTQVDHFTLPKNADEKMLLQLRTQLENYNLIIAGVEGIGLYPPGKYNTTEIQRRAVNELVRENRVVFAFFGNAYALRYFYNIHHAEGLVLAYQNDPLTQELAAQLIFGASDADGKLPVTIDDRFKIYDGLPILNNHGFAYTIPEEVGINSVLLHHKIDSIATEGMKDSAYPGCQVLIAKEGKVIFHKCYGYHTYEDKNLVKKEDLYDWASITKVTGPLPALMKLVEEKKINLNTPLSRYWPDFKKSYKKNLKIREILAHQSRLVAYIPYWRMALQEDKTLDPKVFSNHPDKDFSIRVSTKLWMNKTFRKTMYDTIRESKLLPRKKYLYSGLSFFLYPEIITKLTNKDYETYLKQTFYKPLGAYTITFNPYLHFPLNRIIPTEVDTIFRHETVHGFVHDEGAAMMGGVSGNAGLFGTTGDLAKIFQMYMQKGYFAGKRYLSEETVNEFIRIQYPENENRRGLGFDKPLIDNAQNPLNDAYPAPGSSVNSFGHSGFTGTFAWADPDNGLLFIFMSNRVYPTRENQNLYQMNIRTAMHQSIYDCIQQGL